MILIDYNQVFISALMIQIGSKPGAEIQEDLVRHMVLKNILSYRKKFKQEFGEIVICADDMNYWRKTAFPYYKASRKKLRKASGFDWNAIFTTLDKIRNELKEHFPYKVIKVSTAEADDIIATISKISQDMDNPDSMFEEPVPILILSGDRDFLQLQKYPNVRQYSPIKKRFLKTDSPTRVLREHIMRGDESDGVPNFLSPDDTFVNPAGRQSPMYTKKVDAWLNIDPKDYPKTFSDIEMKRYDRNKALIDLSHIPTHIEDSIVEEFNKEPQGKRNKLLSYFIKNKLKLLTEDIGDF